MTALLEYLDFYGIVQSTDFHAVNVLLTPKNASIIPDSYSTYYARNYASIIAVCLSKHLTLNYYCFIKIINVRKLGEDGRPLLQIWPQIQFIKCILLPIMLHNFSLKRLFTLIKKVNTNIA